MISPFRVIWREGLGILSFLEFLISTILFWQCFAFHVQFGVLLLIGLLEIVYGKSNKSQILTGIRPTPSVSGAVELKGRREPRGLGQHHHRHRYIFNNSMFLLGKY